VRLVLGTGVCVLVEQLGGARAGWTKDVRIEQVDVPMPDALFTEPQPH
jgi:hypothetical protein